MEKEGENEFSLHLWKRLRRRAWFPAKEWITGFVQPIGHSLLADQASKEQLSHMLSGNYPPLQQVAVTTTENGIYSETTTIIPTSKLKPTTGNFCISNEKSVSRATVCFTIKTMHQTVLYVLLILLWKDWHFSQTTRLTRSVAGFIKSSINAYKNTFCLPQPKL